MRFRHVSAWVGTLGLVAAGALSAPVQAAVDAVPKVEGEPLALDADPAPRYTQVDWFSNDYFTYQPEPDAQYHYYWQVRSTVDGSVVAEFPSTQANGYKAPEIAGRTVVTRTEVDSRTTQIEYQGLGVAETPGPVAIAPDETVEAVLERGVLVSERDADNMTRLVVKTTSSATVVDGVPDAFGVRVMDQDGDDLLLSFSGKLYLLNLNVPAPVLVGEALTEPRWAALTPNRVIWLSDTPTKQLVWKNRDGSPGGDLDLQPSSDVYRTLGDDVALLMTPEGGTVDRREIRPLTLDTGQVGAPVIENVSNAYSLESGKLLVTRADGSVVTVTPGGVTTTLATTPPNSLVAKQVVISNGQVLTAFEGGAVRETSLTAAGWSARTDIPTATTSDDSLQLGGGNLVRDNVVRWQGGERQLGDGAAVLGRGGALLSHYDFGTQLYSIQNARTGAQLATRRGGQSFALDGNWLWDAPNLSTGVLSGKDLVTGQARTAQSTVRCNPHSFAVAGRWALVNCSASQRYAVDLLGVVADYKLPDNASAEQLFPAVGEGFVVRLRFVAGVPELVVTDLNSAAHPERVVGPLRGMTWPPGATFAVDDQAGRIAYADPLSRIRVATVSWLAPAPPTQLDTVAPKVATAGAGARVSEVNPIKYAYRFTDNTAVASYDVAYRSAAPGKVLGAWTYPATWQKSKSATVAVSSGLGTDVCFMSRARDARGNVSAWSAASCALTPHDDRGFTAGGSFARIAYRTAYKGTLTQLRKNGATLRKTGETGNRVAVTALAGPKQGLVDVAFAGKKIGRINLAATSVSRKVFTLPVGAMRTGTVTLTSVSAAPASIDAIGLLRA
ncbi:hypothetical protein ACI2LF_32745 [Kribbella sp. NPDC020789]